MGGVFERGEQEFRIVRSFDIVECLPQERERFCGAVPLQSLDRQRDGAFGDEFPVVREPCQPVGFGGFPAPFVAFGIRAVRKQDIDPK